MCHAGDVLLLSNPVSAGYLQNPISVYYCYSAAGKLQCCIAEVTNTPWGERVRFLFDPVGTTMPKSLHVSPMMDMQSEWYAPSRPSAMDARIDCRLCSAASLPSSLLCLEESSRGWPHTRAAVRAASKAWKKCCVFVAKNTCS